MPELGAMRHDRMTYLDTARERIRGLERTLLAELESKGDTRDLGWDTESLRRDVDPGAERE